jgi:hypothetical protein
VSQSYDAACAACAGRWPEQCDVAACQRYLQGAFEHARSRPMHDVLFTQRVPSEQAVQRKDIIKRWRGLYAFELGL